ncbi:MAG: hypothetical protein ACJ768_12845 [Gaiellaceae bacterium]
MADWVVVVDVRPPDGPQRLWSVSMRGYDTAAQAVEHATAGYDPAHVHSVEAERTNA